jgi:crotonobetainyl-CoA:carnitine CoA-transferase CaiB-like acyl-CoA transferase
VAMLDVGTNFMWPDTMALTAEMMVDKDPQTYAGKASRRPPQSLMPTRDGHGVLMLWPEAPHFEKCLGAFFPELLGDERFADIPSRLQNFRDFQALL